MKTLCDGGGIDEVASTQATDDVLIQVFDLHSDLFLRKHPPSPVTLSPKPTREPFNLGSSPFHQIPQPSRARR